MLKVTHPSLVQVVTYKIASLDIHIVGDHSTLFSAHIHVALHLDSSVSSHTSGPHISTAIMPSTASFSDPKVYHILTYGTLLGSNLFQTFLGGPLAFKALPRPQFSTLQQAIFPPYFTFQAALPVLLALTWPGDKIAQVGVKAITQNTGFWGIFSDNSFWTAGVPVAIMFATSAANLFVFGPATTKVMKERKHQGKIGWSRMEPDGLSKTTCQRGH
jgi:hypothetical protein